MNAQLTNCSGDTAMIRTLVLQVEQSKRERRLLEIENALLRKSNRYPFLYESQK